MGYGGKVEERQRARELRAQSWTLVDIARELGVSKSSVSLWVRDVPFEPRPRNRGHPGHAPHPMHLAKLAEIERCRAEAQELIGRVSDREFLVFGLALYAGEGAKRDGELRLANTDPRLMAAYAAWLRRFFAPDESRFRVALYLHEGLDADAAAEFWSAVTGVPRQQFRRPYRAKADRSIRRRKHVNGCATLIYNCTPTHRRVIAMIEQITSQVVDPG